MSNHRTKHSTFTILSVLILNPRHRPDPRASYPGASCRVARLPRRIPSTGHNIPREGGNSRRIPRSQPSCPALIIAIIATTTMKAILTVTILTMTIIITRVARRRRRPSGGAHGRCVRMGGRCVRRRRVASLKRRVGTGVHPRTRTDVASAQADNASVSVGLRCSGGASAPARDDRAASARACTALSGCSLEPL